MNRASLSLLKGMNHANASDGAGPSAAPLQLNLKMKDEEHSEPLHPEQKHAELKHAEFKQSEKMDEKIPDTDITELNSGDPPDDYPIPPSSPMSDDVAVGDKAPPPPAGKPEHKKRTNEVDDMRNQADTFAASQREMADIQMMQSTVAAQTSALTAMNDALNERTKKLGESMKNATSN